MAQSSSSSPLDQLRKAVIGQKKVFLPPEPEDPALEMLHQAVTHYDQQVSPLVISLLTGQPVEISDLLEESRGRVVQLLETPDIATNRKADFYRSYAARLDQMLALVRQITG